SPTQPTARRTGCAVHAALGGLDYLIPRVASGAARSASSGQTQIPDHDRPPRRLPVGVGFSSPCRSPHLSCRSLAMDALLTAILSRDPPKWSVPKGTYGSCQGCVRLAQENLKTSGILGVDTLGGEPGLIPSYQRY